MLLLVMNKKQRKREKYAWIVAVVGGLMSLASLILLFISMIAYNEAVLVFAYNLAYLIILVGFAAFVLTISAIGMDRAEKDSGYELLRFRSGKLAMAILVVAFAVIALARGQVYRHEIDTGVRNPNGTIRSVK